VTDRRIPEPVLADIRARLPIESVVARLVRLRRSGRAFRGQCPFCGSRSQALAVDPHRRTFHCYACGQHGDVMSWVMRTEGCDFRQAVARCAAEAGLDWQDQAGPRRVVLAPPPDRPPPDDGPRRERAARKWARAVPIAEGSPQALYLAGRGLWPIAPATAQVLRATMLRYPPDGEGAALTWPAGRQPHPVLIARVAAPGVALTAVHCTFLAPRPDGSVGKLVVDDDHPAKLVFGPLPAGSAIRLFAPAETMGVAEGIETALAASALFDGLAVWAAISAGGVARFVPPRVCGELLILADNDKPRVTPRVWRPEGEGMHVARQLQARMAEAGRRARIFVPIAPHGDFADVLMARRVAA
jgi:putative DNA primase/helicase